MIKIKQNIIVQGERYWYYDTFNTWKEAIITGKKIRNITKAKWYVKETEMYGKTKYNLYIKRRK